MKCIIARSATFMVIVTGTVFGCGKGEDKGKGKGSEKPISGPPKIAITAVGKAKGSAERKLISTAGDTLSSADGRLTIEIPSGALAAPETLSIQTISSEAPGGIGTAYRLGPDGTTFAAPVRLTFNYSARDLSGTAASALKVAYQGKEGGWNAIKKVTRDESAKLLSVETSHFSDWSLVASYQLRPPSALLKTNESIRLTVSACSDDDTNDDLSALSNPLYECRPDPATELIVVDEWTVNAIKNGNSTVGTITNGNDDAALYIAPSTAPRTGNPVAVSASVIDKLTRKKMLLSSSISIELKPALSGSITSTQVGADGRTITTAAQVNFEWDEASQMYMIEPVSYLDVTLDAANGGCVAHATAPTHQPIASQEGHILVTELGYLGSGHTSVVLTGEQGCNGQKEPLSLPEDINWWPTHPAYIFIPKPDGSLEDRLVGAVNEATGEKIDVEWSLVPQAP